MEVCIARQPIYTRYRKAVGYELLYRSGITNAFDPRVDGSYATNSVISEALMDFGMESLTNGKLGFVNFTEKLLFDKLPELLDPKLFAIEVLEDVTIDGRMQKRLHELKKFGFTLALDDYCGAPMEKGALSCFDIVKLDFRLTAVSKRKQIARELLNAGKQVLAEKIETLEDFKQAVEIGCHLFQGYFFEKPMNLHNRRRDIATVTAVRLTNALSKKEVSLDELATIARKDAHVTLSLLRKMRSITYYRGYPIRSVKDAFIRMGIEETRRWAMLMLLRDSLGKTADELIRIALVRAVFCEKLSTLAGHEEWCDDAFYVGILSIIDHDDPEFPTLIQDLNLSELVRSALAGHDTFLNRILKLVRNYEAGEWEKLGGMRASLPHLYREAVNYADSVIPMK